MTADDLLAQRRQLIDAFGNLTEEREMDFRTARDLGNSNADAIRLSYEPKIEAARQAIAAFDKAHPEVLAAIRAKKDEIRRDVYAGVAHLRQQTETDPETP